MIGNTRVIPSKNDHLSAGSSVRHIKCCSTEKVIRYELDLTEIHGPIGITLCCCVCNSSGKQVDMKGE